MLYVFLWGVVEFSSRLPKYVSVHYSHGNVWEVFVFKDTRSRKYRWSLSTKPNKQLLCENLVFNRTSSIMDLGTVESLLIR